MKSGTQETEIKKPVYAVLNGQIWVMSKERAQAEGFDYALTELAALRGEFETVLELGA